MTIMDAPARGLADDLLERCRLRAAAYDHDNTFFTDDLEELAASGYLQAAVPADRGGWGLSLPELSRQQRALARHAPPTALALSMHHYNVGTAAVLAAAGDPVARWVLDEATAGRIFASGHAEAGNDVPVALSTTVAERVTGGWRLTGRKHFGSLGPVWDYLNAHAMDVSDPAAPLVVHAYVARNTPGVSIVDAWDTTGMRASQSYDTVLDGVFVPDERVALVTPAGDLSAPFTGVMATIALTLISNVYVGIAERAVELAIASATTKTSIGLERGAMATNPMVQHQIAQAWMAVEHGRTLLERIADDFASGEVDPSIWPARLFGARWSSIENARRAVDLAVEIVGGAAFFRRHELERLARDVRGGTFHPGNTAFTHETVAKFVLGLAPVPRF
jgi:alkylation response protein AidB-like acyl-CoA dehydrogenase